jgi:hypothetical protein
MSAPLNALYAISAVIGIQKNKGNTAQKSDYGFADAFSLYSLQKRRNSRAISRLLGRKQREISRKDIKRDLRDVA